MCNKCIRVAFSISGIVILCIVGDRCTDSPKHTNNIEVTELKDSSFMNYPEPTKELVWKALLFYNIDNPRIVLAQAILETGRFKSRVCKSKKNLFGLWNTDKSEYFVFKHWSHSIKAYMTNIQYRCGKNEDYYGFINRIGYAEDPEYVSKLKEIEDSLIIEEL